MEGALARYLSRTGRRILHVPTIAVTAYLAFDWLWFQGTGDGVLSAVTMSLGWRSRQLTMLALIIAAAAIFALLAFAWDAVASQPAAPEEEKPRSPAPPPASAMAAPEIVRAAQETVTQRLRQGQRREVIRADFVSRGFPAPVIDGILAGFPGEWRSGPLSWSLRLFGVAVAIYGLLGVFGARPGADFPLGAWLATHPHLYIVVALLGIALVFIGWRHFKSYRSTVSRPLLPHCANCGVTVWLGGRMDGKRFCDVVCMENFRYPGVMCQKCVEETTNEAPGELKRVNGTGYWMGKPSSKCPVCYSVVQTRSYYIMYFASRHEGEYRFKWRKSKEYTMARRLRQAARHERVEPR